MSFKRFFILSAFMLLLCPQAGAAQDFTVTLKNGEALPASSYAVKGRKLLLSYPLGSAEIDLSRVASIKSGDGGEVLFTDRGEAAPGAAANAGAPLSAPVHSSFSGRSVAGRAGRGVTPDDPYPSGFFPLAQMKQDPTSADIDALIDSYSDAGETEAEVSDKEIDLIFSAFFEE